MTGQTPASAASWSSLWKRSRTSPSSARILGGTDAAGAREGHDDLTVGEFGDSVLDARGELGEFADERFENGNEGAHELAPGFGLDLADLALRSRAQAVEQLGGGAPAGITVLGEEGPQALLAEPRGAVGGGIALGESERDRAVDFGEDRGGAGPEALEQAPELVGQGDPLHHQVIAGAHQRAQRPDLVRAGRERAEAAAIGAQDIGEHIRVAGIALTAGGAIARPAGLDDVGMDRHDRVTGRDQRVDDEAGRPLDGDRYLRRRRQPGQARDQLANPLGVVPHRKARNNAAGLVKDADSMGGTAPIHSRVVGHISGPPRCDRLARAGRSCGSLIDRRSGRLPVARHPVVRPNLPAPAARRVSRGPSTGKRHRPSRRALGWVNATPLRGFAYPRPKVHQ